jgi:hypothetical protein
MWHTNSEKKKHMKNVEENDQKKKHMKNVEEKEAHLDMYDTNPKLGHQNRRALQTPGKLIHSMKTNLLAILKLERELALSIDEYKELPAAFKEENEEGWILHKTAQTKRVSASLSSVFNLFKSVCVASSYYQIKIEELSTMLNEYQIELELKQREEQKEELPEEIHPRVLVCPECRSYDIRGHAQSEGIIENYYCETCRSIFTKPDLVHD